MADAKISALPTGGSVVAGDILPYVNVLSSVTTAIGVASLFTNAILNTPSVTGGTVTRITIVSPSVTGNLESSGVFTTVGGQFISGAASVLGYVAGAGGNVIQSIGGTKEQAVALNRAVGKIILSNSVMAASVITSVLFGNSVIGVNDVITLNYIGNGLAGTNMRSYALSASVVAPGSALINLKSNNNFADASSVFLGFAVIKGAIT